MKLFEDIAYGDQLKLKGREGVFVAWGKNAVGDGKWLWGSLNEGEPTVIAFNAVEQE